MSWKVSKERIEIFPHPNADAIELAKVGDLQIIVVKGLYKTGDIIVVFPYKTVLSGNETIHATQDIKYLGGADKDRVIEHTFRGEITQGANIPLDVLVTKLANAGLMGMSEDLLKASIGEDISELLNLSKYEPPIPVNLTGLVERMELPYTEHDVSQFGIAADKLIGKYITVSEKLHGMLTSLSYIPETGEVKVTTKGLGEREQQFQEVPPFISGAIDRNGILEAFPKLARAAQEIGNLLVNKVKKLVTIQVIGELTGVQKGYHYGHMHPMLFLFRVIYHYDDNSVLEFSPHKMALMDKVLCVPLMFEGLLFADQTAREDYITKNEYGYVDTTTVDNLYGMAKGMEKVSGKQTHIMEGCCIVTMGERNFLPVFDTVCKLINPAYMKKSKGDEIS